MGNKQMGPLLTSCLGELIHFLWESWGHQNWIPSQEISEAASSHRPPLPSAEDSTSLLNTLALMRMIRDENCRH